MKFNYSLNVSGEISAANKQDAIEKVRRIKISKFQDVNIEMEEEAATNYIG